MPYFFPGAVVTGLAARSERPILKTKREQYGNTLPFLNPISYEKPIR
jgi:hypothetical protein